MNAPLCEDHVDVVNLSKHEPSGMARHRCSRKFGELTVCDFIRSCCARNNRAQARSKNNRELGAPIAQTLAWIVHFVSVVDRAVHCPVAAATRTRPTATSTLKCSAKPQLFSIGASRTA